MNTKKLLLALSISAISSTSAMASTLGVSMAYFDDNFLTIVRNNMSDEAKKQSTEINFEDAQGDIGRQVSQIQNFIASGVDAIIVNPVDSAATGKMIKLATEAKIPMVFVNRKPDSDGHDGFLVGRAVTERGFK